MSSGARHGVGVILGLVLTPLIALGLFYGVERLLRSLQRFQATFNEPGSERWVGALTLLAVAAVLGLLAGSRVSPMAALIPGVVFTGVGLMWVAAPRWMFDHTYRKLPGDTLDRGYSFVGPYGVFLILGGLLLASALAPSRWRTQALRPAPAPYGGAAAGPPAFQQGRPPTPPLQQSPSPFQTPPPPYDPNRPAQGSPAGPPPYDPNRPPAQPATPAPPPYDPGRAQAQSPAPPPYDQGGPPLPQVPAPPPPSATPAQPASAPGSGADSEPGEWTRMYGGDEIRGDEPPPPPR